MSCATFEHARRHRLNLTLPPLVIGLPGVALVLGLAYHNHPRSAVAILVIGTAGVWFMRWRLRQIAERVVVSDGYIEAWNYGGWHLRLAWARVYELRQFDVRTRMGVIKIVRLVTRDGTEQVVFTDLINGFEQLMGEVRARAPHARTGAPPTRWERLLSWL